MTAQLLATVPALPVRAAGIPALHTERLRVALQVTDPLTAAGLRRWLRRGEGVAPVAGGPDAAVDVVVVAPDPMPQSWLRRAVAAGRSGAPDARVVLVVDGPPTMDAESLGADVLMSRGELSEDTFLAAVRAGGAVDGDDAVAVAADPTEDGPADDRAATVLGMLADGHDLAEIASALFYSERTVKNVLYSYLGEIGARNRVHAVACAIRAGIV